MGPRFKRVLLCAFVLLAIVENFNGATVQGDLHPAEASTVTNASIPQAYRPSAPDTTVTTGSSSEAETTPPEASTVTNASIPQAYRPSVKQTSEPAVSTATGATIAPDTTVTTGSSSEAETTPPASSTAKETSEPAVSPTTEATVAEASTVITASTPQAHTPPTASSTAKETLEPAVSPTTEATIDTTVATSRSSEVPTTTAASSTAKETSEPAVSPTTEATVAEASTVITASTPQAHTPPAASSTAKETSEPAVSPTTEASVDTTVATSRSSEVPTTPDKATPAPKSCDDIKDDCKAKGKICKMQDEKPVCSDTCPDNETQHCESVPYRFCRVRDGESECYCKEGLRYIDGRCEIAKKIVVRFKIKKNAARHRRDAAEQNCAVDRTELVKMIKKEVPNVDEDSIKCTGDDVVFEVFAENAQEVATDVRNKLKNCGENCPLGSVSFSDVKADRAKQCENLKAIANDFGMKCTENDTTDTTFYCDTTKAEPIGETKLHGIPFQVCKPLSCNKTCADSDRKHCVGGSCVCKPQYKYDSADGKCISICETKPSPCFGEAVCELGQDYHSFYCRCPPKRTGPLCQRDNKSFLSAQLNIVIVGVVLSSLLLMCFVVSASIISRLKKKLEGPSFKKDPERPTQRELRGYDGPFRASDPASLHRERDYTSL